jgi:hypothetical protein
MRWSPSASLCQRDNLRAFRRASDDDLDMPGQCRRRLALFADVGEAIVNAFDLAADAVMSLWN